MSVLKNGNATVQERPTGVIQIYRVVATVVAVKNTVDVQFLFLRARNVAGVIDD